MNVEYWNQVAVVTQMVLSGVLIVTSAISLGIWWHERKRQSGVDLVETVGDVTREVKVRLGKEFSSAEKAEFLEKLARLFSNR